MVDKERIGMYKNWFDNLSFFGNNSFIIDRIEDLWNLINYIGMKYSNFCNCYINKDEKYSEMSEEECINLVQKFFDNHNIQINIRELIDNKTLILKNNTTKDNDDYFNTKQDGLSDYNENGDKILWVKMEGTIYDCMILIHELMHYSNQPDDKRNFVSDLLTEAVSYAFEFIFCEDLKDTIYQKDRNLHFKGLEKLLYSYSYQIYYIYKIILLYKEKKDISKELYKDVFNDDGYEETIDEFEKYASLNKSILHDTWFVIGLPLAIYILEEYRKDEKFLDILQVFNNSINDKNLEECLGILNMNSNQEIIDKIKISTESFSELLNELYGLSQKKRK